MGVKLEWSLKMGILFQWIPSIIYGCNYNSNVGLLPPAEVTPQRFKYITIMRTKHTHILSQAHRLWSNLYKSV